LCISWIIKRLYHTFFVSVLRIWLVCVILVSIILPLVWYGCETWSLTLWEEHKLRVFGNSVLRRIFGPERDEITREWRKLRNE
jgi:hypothetical protein